MLYHYSDTLRQTQSHPCRVNSDLVTCVMTCHAALAFYAKSALFARPALQVRAGLCAHMLTSTSAQQATRRPHGRWVHLETLKQGRPVA